MLRQTLQISQRRFLNYGSRTISRLPTLQRSKPNMFMATRRSYALSTEGESIESKIDNLSLGEYTHASNEYLETLGDELEMFSEDFPQIDCELTQGVMTLTVPPNGTYVINKQPPNKQIWLSSPISGPKRYDMIDGKWTTLRDNTTLTSLLEEEISAALETEIRFENIES